MQRAILALLAFFIAASSIASSAHAQWGRYEGKLDFEWLRDGRNMRLKQRFSYIGADKTIWAAPAGTETDGASVPQIFWAKWPPFTGKYREAAVIHDHFCRTKTRRWQDVHNMFYAAMRASGVSDNEAKLLWSAVYAFGPRWDPVTRKKLSKAATPTPTARTQERTINALQKWIAERNPSQDEIIEAIEEGTIPKQ